MIIFPLQIRLLQSTHLSSLIPYTWNIYMHTQSNGAIMCWSYKQTRTTNLNKTTLMRTQFTHNTVTSSGAYVFAEILDKGTNGVVEVLHSDAAAICNDQLFSTLCQ